MNVDNAFAKEIEKELLGDRKPSFAIVTPVLPDSARGQIDVAVEILRKIQDDAKVLAHAIEAIISATSKLQSEVGRAREAITKAQTRL